MEEERVDNFAVAEFEDFLAAIDNGYADPERGEHDRIFETDHAAPDDDHGARDRVELQDLVGIKDVLAVERNVRRPRGFGAARHEDMPGLQVHCLFVALDDDFVRTGESGLAAIQVDPVPVELVMNDFDFVLDDVGHLAAQIVHRDLPLVAVAFAEHVALPKAGEVKNCLAHRLGGNRPGVNAHSPWPESAALDHRDALVELGRGDGPFLPGRAAANDHQVVTHDGPLSIDGSGGMPLLQVQASPLAVRIPLQQIDLGAGRAIHKESPGRAFWRRTG